MMLHNHESPHGGHAVAFQRAAAKQHEDATFCRLIADHGWAIVIMWTLGRKTPNPALLARAAECQRLGAGYAAAARAAMGIEDAPWA